MILIIYKYCEKTHSRKKYVNYAVSHGTAATRML